MPRARDGHRAPPDRVRRRGRHAGRRRRAARARGRPAGDDAAIRDLRTRFESGAARLVDRADDLRGALNPVTPRVEAPVPTLLRETGEGTVLFVPAIHPRATEIAVGGDPDDWLSWARGLAYGFDAARYPGYVDVLVRGVEGAPQLWEPFSGARRAVAAEAVDGGVRVRVPFADGPCALLVWGAAADGVAPARATAATARTRCSTARGRCRSRRRSRTTGATSTRRRPGPVRSRRRGRSSTGRSRTRSGASSTPPTARVRSSPDRPLPAAAVARAEPAAAGGVGSAGWREAVWSPSRGIHKDPVHWQALGPSGRVPEEFIDVGAVERGRPSTCAPWCRRRCARHASRGGRRRAKAAWLNGEAVALEEAGHLATAPVRLRGGDNVLDLRLTADRGGRSAARALRLRRRRRGVPAAGVVARRRAVVEERGRRLLTVLSLPADAESATVLLGANGPCRPVVDGVEAGRQGGFDPYEEGDFDRLQPYDLPPPCGAGDHDIVIELLDMGRSRPAAILDGARPHRARHARRAIRRSWRATRDGRQVRSTSGYPRLRRSGVRARLAPAASAAGRRLARAGPHRRRRGRAVTRRRHGRRSPAAAADAAAGARTDRGTARRPVAPRRWRSTGTPCRRGGPVGTYAVALPEAAGRRSPARSPSRRRPGCQAGPCSPVPFAVTSAPGASSWSTGRPRAPEPQRRRPVPATHRAPAGAAPAQPPTTILDLGEVRGTAEVLVDGRRVGVRVCSPYTFDLTGRVGPAGAARGARLQHARAAPRRRRPHAVRVRGPEAFGPVRTGQRLRHPRRRNHDSNGLDHFHAVNRT